MSDISVYITSDLTSSERRISPQWDLDFLKGKLEHITGIEPKYQTLQYYPTSDSNQFIVISNSHQYSKAKDKATLVSELNIIPYSRIHVEDTNDTSVTAGLSQEGSPEAEYQYSEEDYRRRDKSVLKWKEEQKLGRFDPEYNSIKQRNIDENNKLVANIKVNDRCRTINIQGERRGTIKFVGKLPKLDQGESMWVGVEFDEPVGKNSGMLEGERIFECRENHGSFLRPKQVEVGDFPEIDPFASDDEI